MNKERFWIVINEAKKQCNNENEDMIPILIDLLSKLEISEIATWHNIFVEYMDICFDYRDKIYPIAYIINDGCSDDGFDYFRGWLIAQGKDIFLTAFSNPDALVIFDIPKGSAEEDGIFDVSNAAYSIKLELTDDNEDTDEDEEDEDGSNDDEFDELCSQYALTEKIKSEILTEIQFHNIDIINNNDCENDYRDKLKKSLPKLFKKYFN